MHIQGEFLVFGLDIEHSRSSTTLLKKSLHLLGCDVMLSESSHVVHRNSQDAQWRLACVEVWELRHGRPLMVPTLRGSVSSAMIDEFVVLHMVRTSA